MNKALKTPLRYPGGKSRALKKMDPYIPDLRDYDEYMTAEVMLMNRSFME